MKASLVVSVLLLVVVITASASLLALIVSASHYPELGAPAFKFGEHNPDDNRDHMVEEHECIHDTHVVKMIEKEDREFAANGTTRPFSRRHTTAAQDRDAYVLAVGAIRIVIRTPDLEDTSKYCTSSTDTSPDFLGGTIACASDTVFTSTKKSVLLNDMIPAALNKIKRALSVTQVVGNLVVPVSSCGQHTVPLADRTTGVADADFVLYVSAAPTTGTTIAWCGYCSQDVGGRPTVGRMNVSPKYMTWPADSPKTKEERANTIVHEIFHGLGYSSSLFLKYPGSLTGQTTLRGKTVTQLTSATVLAKAKEYFSCTTLTGVEIEDEGSSGTQGSHVDRRTYRDDVMAGIVGYSRLSTITLAVFQDSGKYTVDYTHADAMLWGYHAGCNFITQKCNAVGIQGPTKIDHWCSATNTSAVSVSRRYCGYCDVATYTSSISPTYFQHFADPKKGGQAQLMDFCPTVRPYSNRICDDTGYSATSAEIDAGFTFASGGRCLNTVDLYKTGTSSPGDRRICIDTQCLDSNARVQVRVRGGAWLDCPTNGGYGRVTLPAGYAYQGKIDCPPAAELCVTFSSSILSTTGATPSPSGSSSTDSSSTPDLGIILGASIGGFVFLIFVAVLIYWFCCKGGGGGGADGSSKEPAEYQSSSRERNQRHANHHHHEQHTDGIIRDPGDWVHDSHSGMEWSDQIQCYRDVESSHIYDPNTQQWYDPFNKQWYFWNNAASHP